MTDIAFAHTWAVLQLYNLLRHYLVALIAHFSPNDNKLVTLSGNLGKPKFRVRIITFLKELLTDPYKRRYMSNQDIFNINTYLTFHEVLVYMPTAIDDTGIRHFSLQRINKCSIPVNYHDGRCLFLSEIQFY
jgi:hypothetical protein